MVLDVMTGEDQALHPMQVMVPRELHSRLQQQADEEERTLAQVVRRAFRMYLEYQQLV